MVCIARVKKSWNIRDLSLGVFSFSVFDVNWRFILGSFAVSVSEHGCRWYVKIYSLVLVQHSDHAAHTLNIKALN